MALSARNPNSVLRSSSLVLPFVFALLLSFSLMPSPASAQTPEPAGAASATTAPATLVEQARSGGASLDEVGHAFVENALKGAELPIAAAKLNEELPGIDEVIAPVVKKAIEEHLPTEKTAKLA